MTYALNLLLLHLLTTCAVRGYSAAFDFAHKQPTNLLHRFDFFRGNAPRYRIPTQKKYDPDRTNSNAPGSPFDAFLNNNKHVGSYFPEPGVAVCPKSSSYCRHSAYRTFDGSCNHLDNPKLGAPNSRYGRLLLPRYSDGVSSPPRSVTGKELPGARLVSLHIFGELDIPDHDFTLMNMQWGQIMTHDMSMQASGNQAKKHSKRCCSSGKVVASNKDPNICFAIYISLDDPVYSKVGIECLDFVRTLTDRDLNHEYKNGTAEQLSMVTSYLDLSLVYGNSIQKNREIRVHQGGKMAVEQRHGGFWLPSSKNTSADCNSVDSDEVCYTAGDSRVNQNPGLAILQTILLREHNRIADALSQINPHHDDKMLFEEARKINIAQYQHISYNEWLPLFLGYENMFKNRLIFNTPQGDYVNDFDPNVDPSVINAHATAAFRFFHSQIEGRLDLISEKRSVRGSLRLSDWFNRPTIIEMDNNLDFLIRGHTTQPEQQADINFDIEIKHFLFRGNKTFGSDLRAFDIQRDRDHGLAAYNDFREYCGLRRANSWEDFADLLSLATIKKLKVLYESHDDVEVTVGGSLESHIAGALAGPTFLCILTEQFYRTRVGDRFFYENEDNISGFTRDQLTEIRKTSLARILCDNGNHISSMQPSAFLTISHSNPVVPCSNIPEIDLSRWLEQKPYG